jgi:hypothetical protein
MTTTDHLIKGAKKVIYLSGPMKGYPESNYPAFHAAASVLRKEGHRVYNPAEFPFEGNHEDFPLRMAFASYCSFICLEATTICLLPGWEKSTGVSAELTLARNCGLEILEYGETIKAAGELRVIISRLGKEEEESE